MAVRIAANHCELTVGFVRVLLSHYKAKNESNLQLARQSYGLCEAVTQRWGEKFESIRSSNTAWYRLR